MKRNRHRYHFTVTMGKEINIVCIPYIYYIDLLINHLKAFILKPNDTQHYHVFSLKYNFSIKTQWT